MSDIKERLLDVMVVCEPYSTRELAQEVGEPRRTVLYNLEQLADDGEINRKQSSKRDVSWWIGVEAGQG
ncbi:hypothetical protein C497_03925 [Halalkalicoccus jeotgali B3]|uniref:Uncharacterized protein n=1 Tax=Halalkalicoccus jeotgali (strain DSM 18796 / CECT 7217 / JCM 14584 / KCTC 4019 / B3) TaxID=795797 RepID=D8J9Y1_HALJB|nr:hypothetical protein HacjB3_05560 [Halalkalicoccus jeotgali B3]ELY40215.1 hypothetical protein C497_03925 [Halalkalicoccus jeotgali B3]